MQPVIPISARVSNLIVLFRVDCGMKISIEWLEERRKENAQSAEAGLMILLGIRSQLAIQIDLEEYVRLSSLRKLSTLATSPRIWRAPSRFSKLALRARSSVRNSGKVVIPVGNSRPSFRQNIYLTQFQRCSWVLGETQRHCIILWRQTNGV